MQEGIVTSSNSLDFTSEDMTRMHENNASIKEMEAAGIVWVTHLFDVPFLALKSVTDIVDGERATQDEFLENLHKAAEALEVRRNILFLLFHLGMGGIWHRVFSTISLLFLFLALKSVTDIEDGKRATQDEFLENLHKAAEALEVRQNCFPCPAGSLFSDPFSGWGRVVICTLCEALNCFSPSLSLKSMTDIVEEDKRATQDEFLGNLHKKQQRHWR